MIEFIDGQIVGVEPTYIVILTNNKGYRILSANPYYFQKFMNQTVRIYVELVVREDSLTLYGFKDLVEKQLFNQLNKVSNIGPKTALSILALDDHQGLIEAIETENVKLLTKFPGVGKRTAQQMILDLNGKLDFLGVNVSPGTDDTTETNLAHNILEEVNEALTGLGYSAREIKSIEKRLKAQTFETTQDALSQALKLLVK